MATKYYEREGTFLKNDGQEQWCVYNSSKRGWERHARAKAAYEFAGQNPFDPIPEDYALEGIAAKQKHYDESVRAFRQRQETSGEEKAAKKVEPKPGEIVRNMGMSRTETVAFQTMDNSYFGSDFGSQDWCPLRSQQIFSWPTCASSSS